MVWQAEWVVYFVNRYFISADFCGVLHWNVLYIFRHNVASGDIVYSKTFQHSAYHCTYISCLSWFERIILYLVFHSPLKIIHKLVFPMLVHLARNNNNPTRNGRFISPLRRLAPLKAAGLYYCIWCNMTFTERSCDLADSEDAYQDEAKVNHPSKWENIHTLLNRFYSTLPHPLYLVSSI